MKGKLKRLRQALAEAKAKGRKMCEELAQLEEIETPTKDQTAKMAALSEEISEVEAEVESLDTDVQAAEASLDRERTFAAAAGDDEDDDTDRARGYRTNEEDPARTHGFRNLGDFAQAVRASTPGHDAFIGSVDERLINPPGRQATPTNFHQEGGTGEGYMVPPSFRDEIFDLVFVENDLTGMVDAEPTRSNSVGLGADESTPWGSSGVQANWRAEGAQMSPSKLLTEERQVKLHELYAFVTATEELLEDAPRLNARLTRKAPEAIRWKASEAIMWGTGAGQPLGWMNGGSVVSVAKESGQSAATVVGLNVSKMYSRMLGSSIARAVWLANIDIFPQLATMTVGDQPIWTPPSSGFTNAPGGFLFGRPIMWSEHAQTLGTLGDLQFVDPKGYFMAHKQNGITFAESMHLYFDYNLRAFRWTFRLGGQPYLENAVSPAKGSATKSHFVALATRS